MARQTTILQVFISSPSDVQNEREILESILDELNKSFSKTINVMFETLRWETDVHPSFGDDPQTIINEQIGDTYDIFIGILWGRFGTPTPRASSGTLEEFDRAFKRLKDINPPEIMFYFKDTPIPPSKIDPVQLQSVQDFRKLISEKGGLYSVFEDDSGFQNSLRAHLIAVSNKIIKRDINTVKKHIPKNDNEEAIQDTSDDFGYLDYLEIYENRMADFNSTLTIISDATERVGNQTERRTQEVEEFAKQPYDAKAAHRIIKRTSDDLYSYADILKKHLPTLSDCRESAFQAFNNALLFLQELNNDDDDIIELQSNLNNLVSSLQSSRQGLTGFKNSVQNLPRLKSDLNKAKRTVVEQLNILLKELDTTEQTLNNLLESVGKMIEPIT